MSTGFCRMGEASAQPTARGLKRNSHRAAAMAVPRETAPPRANQPNPSVRPEVVPEKLLDALGLALGLDVLGEPSDEAVPEGLNGGPEDDLQGVRLVGVQ